MMKKKFDARKSITRNEAKEKVISYLLDSCGLTDWDIGESNTIPRTITKQFSCGIRGDEVAVCIDINDILKYEIYVHWPVYKIRTLAQTAVAIKNYQQALSLANRIQAFIENLPIILDLDEPVQENES